MKKRMDRDSRREQIAEAALKLAAKNISAITVENVAKACKIVPSALYRHYKNKDEIFDGLRDLVNNKLRENATIAAKEETSPLAILKNLALKHGDLIYKYPGIPRLLFSDQVANSDSLKRKGFLAIMDEYRKVLAMIAKKGQQTDEIRTDIKSEDVVFMFLGTVVPPSFLFHLSDGEFDPRPQIQRNLILFEDAVKNRNISEES
ncbi:TetR/AcrR family transcriptional regulator [Desulfovibrio gilichinskyi]|uniref:Transcriptional regulator, TetR family n=1 Tax=Desulfovibrio gilichinskyi TaxID=1519643 RepID=A0A1X7C1Q8_9BACT|nr:TetR/AcrR family transcriptional regulator [Desulfovibrio gilichinskyi]SME88403.1 transcriptional regulator, TetR family [Desulfovibrio gilichinskyi]